MSEKIEHVGADVEAHDGAITMARSGSANLYVDATDLAPLSTGETHATLRIVEDVEAAFETTVELDGAELDALADAIYHAQQELQEGGR